MFQKREKSSRLLLICEMENRHKAGVSKSEITVYQENLLVFCRMVVYNKSTKGVGISKCLKGKESVTMTVIKELLRTEADGSLSFGDYSLAAKTKLADYEYKGDLMKVKTFNEITKLERNGLFVYESVPGTTVEHFELLDDGVQFVVSGTKDTQITIGLEESTEYQISLDKMDIGVMNTNMGGKLSFSVELEEDKPVQVIIKK